MIEENEEEEKMMKKLEKDLGFEHTKSKGKKLPKSFVVSTVNFGVLTSVNG